MAGARNRAEVLANLARERKEPWAYFVGLEGGLDVIPTTPRILRGGSFYGLTTLVRSGYRYFFAPTNHFFTFGFRVARTLRLDRLTFSQPSRPTEFWFDGSIDPP